MIGGLISPMTGGGSTVAMISCWNYPTWKLENIIVDLVVYIEVGIKLRLN